MTKTTYFETPALTGFDFSEAERIERRALGLPDDMPAPRGLIAAPPPFGRAVVRKRAIHAPSVLNEAPDYPQPVAFSRGLRVDLEGGVTHLLISGTASVGANGDTLYAGDFRAQCWRTYRNITNLLKAEDATWNDIVRCSCYLRDIERDYADFNQIRTEFFSALGLDPLPASTGIQVRLCRSDLLIEIEAHAILDAGTKRA
jgi:enamine deaminase RidA (YjgF/YER057c/UK114 family)